MKINFASTRLAFFLISFLSIFIILSAIIPQRGISEDQITDIQKMLGENYSIIEKLKLDEIYTTPYFFILLGLLAINILSGNIKRFRSVYRTEKTLIRARHLGSILFHFSLILIMIGVILNYLYRFEGIFALTEGQVVSDNMNDYMRESKGPLYRDVYNKFSIKLDSVYLEYSYINENVKAALIDFRQLNNNEDDKTIIHNARPYYLKDYEIHLGPKIGYSPEVHLMNENGKNIFAGFVRIANTDLGNTEKHYDYLMIERLNFKIEIEVLSDSVSIDSTLFKIRIANETGFLYDDTVKINQLAAFDNYKFIITSIRRWCYIDVIESPFLSVVFWGFWLALSGMAIGFIPRVIGKRKK